LEKPEHSYDIIPSEMIKRKFLLFLLPVVFLGFLIACFLLIQTPSFINGLGSVLAGRIGYQISIQGISFYPGLKGDISDLNITRVKIGGMSFYSQHVSFDGKIRMPLKAEVENITLTQPKLIFRLEKKKKLDLSFIKKLPPVHLLTVQKGQLELSFDSSPQIIKLTDFNLKIKEFSPQKGGTGSFRSNLQILSNVKGGAEGTGHIEGNMNFVSIFPKPSGKGFVEFHIDSGSYNSTSFQKLVLRFPIRFDKEKITIESASLSIDSLTNRSDRKDTTLTDLTFQTSLLYDMRSDAISSGNIEGKLSNMGSFKGIFQGTLRERFPWKASFKTSTISFAEAFSFFRPYLSPEYQKWLIKGKGIMEAYFEGQKLSWDGNLALHFKEGEFSSPDGTKAGQSITGKIILKINSLSSGKGAKFDLSSEVQGGELLLGKYYKDFSGEKIAVFSQGNFFLSSSRILDFQSSLDLFNSGNYSLSGSIRKDESTLYLKAEKISHSRILYFFREYLSQNSSSFKNLLLEGESDLDMKTVIKGKKFSFDGIIRVNDTALKLPEKSFSAEQLNAMLPFDLFYPSQHDSDRRGIIAQKGFIKIAFMKKGTTRLEDLAIPVVLSGNRLSIPEDIKISLFGGDVVLKNLTGEEILSPSRQFHLGLTVKGLDISLLSRDTTGQDVSGMIQADFPAITYQDGTWYLQGKAVAEVFGGKVEAMNMSARDIFASSRKIAVDVTFEGINLEKVTEKIKIGKMTGIIQGSLRNFEIEYGQPSRFIFDVDSVKTKGVKQEISVDAINNISILGTGSGLGGMLDAGIRRFFREYPYSRIGMQCTLENDNFSIRGKIHEGGTEYLVRRAFLRGVDVINQNPQNVISFRDMQERIRRISKSN
jgi:hypothetical protein